MVLCFTNISAEIVLYILDYSFCAECYIMVHFDQMLLPQKHQKIFAEKFLCFGTNMFGEIDSYDQCYKKVMQFHNKLYHLSLASLSSLV